MGIKITTDGRPVKVRRKDFNGKPAYSIMLSKKEGDAWVRVYQPIRLRQGYAVSDGQCITIQNAFPAVDSWVKDGKQYTRQVWVIKEFDSDTPYTTPDVTNNVAPAEEIEGFSVDDGDIPF